MNNIDEYIETARENVHQLAEKYADVDYEIVRTRDVLEKLAEEQREIHQQFYNACLHLASLRRHVRE